MSLYIGSPLNVSYAEFFRFMLQFLCLQMCVYGGDRPPRGGGGPSSLGWGTTRALGFGLTFPNPKRALGAHGVPHWGSSAPAHHTHPLAMQPAGGAHASSSSIVARALSAAVSLACSRCALYWGRGRGEGGPPVRGTVGAPAPLVL